MAKTVSIRVQASSQQEAEQTKRWLEQQLGGSLHLLAPHAGRGAGVWFVRGTLQVPVVEAVKIDVDLSVEVLNCFLPTGATPVHLLEDIPDDEAVAVSLENIRKIWPGLAFYLQAQFEVFDQHSHQEGLDRLAIATIKLANYLQGERGTP